MAPTQDPLLLLRQALSSNATITLQSASGEEVFSLPDSSQIHFTSSRTTFPKDTPTRYVSVAPVPGGEASTYDLQTLLFAYLKRNDPAGEYMKQAREQLIPTVSVMDKRSVVDWLSGKLSLEGPEGKIRPLEGADGAAADEGGVGATPSKRELDTTAGSRAGAAGDATGPAVKKQRFVPNMMDQDRVKRMMALIEGPVYGVGGLGDQKVERAGGALKNRETVLKGDRLNNFESVRALVGPRLKMSKEGDAVPAGAAASGAAATTSGVPGKPTKRKQMNPIIIVSPSSSALITMHNVKRFLEDSVFESPNDARMAAGDGGLAEDLVRVMHARSTTSISSTMAGQANGEARKATYYVVDNAEALAKFGPNDEAWERVVCVMTTGQEWQFKQYKWKEPKELFHHVKGVYVQWTIDPPNPKVKGWNVTELRVDPSKRHIDKSIVADFWRNLEAWMAMHKPHLTY